MTETKGDYKIEGKPATIFRTVKNKDNPYVMLDRRPLDNPELSFKAKGILAYLMSRPDGWEVSVSDLANRSVDGEASIRSGLKELRNAGHLKYQVSRNEGRITGWHIAVYEMPIGTENAPSDAVIDELSTPTCGSPDSDFQQVENLQVENLQVENRTQVLMNLSINDLSINTTTSSEIFKLYESEIGLITPLIKDDILLFMDEVDPSWIMDAIREAAKNNKRNWSYCSAILKRWKAEGKTQKRGKRGPYRKVDELDRSRYITGELAELIEH